MTSCVYVLRLFAKRPCNASGSVKGSLGREALAPFQVLNAGHSLAKTGAYTQVAYWSKEVFIRNIFLNLFIFIYSYLILLRLNTFITGGARGGARQATLVRVSGAPRIKKPRYKYVPELLKHQRITPLA